MVPNLKVENCAFIISGPMGDRVKKPREEESVKVAVALPFLLRKCTQTSFNSVSRGTNVATHIHFQ